MVSALTSLTRLEFEMGLGEEHGGKGFGEKFPFLSLGRPFRTDAQLRRRPPLQRVSVRWPFCLARPVLCGMTLCRHTAGTVTLQKGHPIISGCKDGFFSFPAFLTPQRKVTPRAVAHAVPPLEDEAGPLVTLARLLLKPHLCKYAELTAVAAAVGSRSTRLPSLLSGRAARERIAESLAAIEE